MSNLVGKYNHLALATTLKHIEGFRNFNFPSKIQVRARSRNSRQGEPGIRSYKVMTSTRHGCP